MNRIKTWIVAGLTAGVAFWAGACASSATTNNAVKEDKTMNQTAAEKAPQYEIEIVTLDEQPTLTMRFEVAPANVAAKLAEVLPAVAVYAGEISAPMAGMPFSRYHRISGDSLDMEAGMPVRESTPGKGDVKASSLPAGRAAMTWHVGPYDQLGSAHRALDAWAAHNGHEAAGGAWEIYVTDPGQEPDPNKWRTQVFLPLKD